MKFHHIGYVTDNIEATAEIFKQNMGYELSPIVEDDIQRTYIAFLTKAGEPTIELVAPIDEKSSVNKKLKKNGVSPYHVCYEVVDINQTFDDLTEKQGFIPLFRPVEAKAFDNRLICYFYKQEVGYIEILENKQL